MVRWQFQRHRSLFLKKNVGEFTQNYGTLLVCVYVRVWVRGFAYAHTTYNLTFFCDENNDSEIAIQQVCVFLL